MQLDWLTFSLEIVNFLVLIWILQRFLYRPVLDAIARRKAGIEKTLADAASRQKDAQDLERRYRERLVEWEKEKQELREREREAAGAERAQRLDSLRRELDAERDRQRALAEREAAELRDRLEQEAAAQGAQFAARLLGQLAGPETERRIVARFVGDLARLPREKLSALADACKDAGAKAVVSSAFALQAAERGALGEALRAAAGQAVALEFREDPRLLAGLRIESGPIVIDASLQSELRFFSEAGGDAR